MNLLDLAVKVTVDDQASSKIASLGSSIKSGLGTAAAVGVGAMTAFTAAVGGASAALVGGVKEVAEYGDNIDKMSQKMGISATAYQEWDAVMKHSGTSMESLKASMKTLANAVESGNESFERIGITQEQIASMNNEELFAATIEGLQQIDDETERTYLAGQLLGRGATELGALLNMSAEETQAMKDRVHELGGVMSDESVKAAAAFQDSLQDLQTAISGIKRSVTEEFLPSITTVMDGLQEVFTGNYEAGLEKIREGIDDAISKITEIAPKALEVGGQLVMALIQGIAQNIPTMILTLADGITNMANNVAENADSMLEAAGELFMAIATAVAEALPQILSAVGTMLVSLIGSIIEHLPQMLEAGGKLILSLAEGIAGAAWDIVSAIGDLISDAVEAVGEWVGDFFEAGANLIQGLIDGFLSGVSDFLKAVSGAVEQADGTVQYVGQIYSPSRLMKKRGLQLMQGLAGGISDNVSLVTDAMSGIETAMDVNSGIDITADIGIRKNATPQASQGGNVIFYLTYNEGSGKAELVDLIGERMRLIGYTGNAAVNYGY